MIPDGTQSPDIGFGHEVKPPVDPEGRSRGGAREEVLAVVVDVVEEDVVHRVREDVQK